MAKRYFEQATKFWEVEVEETRQTVRFGKLGTPGQQKTKEFDSPSRARAETGKLIAEKTGKGYVEVGGLPRAHRDETLELAIEQSPDDPAPYLAYARWLENKKDPRGEVIVKHVAKPKDRSLLQQHREYLLGDLASGDGPQLQWQFGVIKSAQIVAFSGAEAADDLEAILSLPSARFLRELEIGLTPDGGAPTLQPCVDLLVKRKAPVTLRSLTLGAEGDEGRTGKIAALARTFPKLEQLTLHGDRLELGKNVMWPALRELTLGGAKKSTLKDLVTSKWSKLERLTISFSLDDEVTAKDLAPLFAASAFPSLKDLKLAHCEVPAFTQSALIAQLRSLRVSNEEGEVKFNEKRLKAALTRTR